MIQPEKTSKYAVVVSLLTLVLSLATEKHRKYRTIQVTRS